MKLNQARPKKKTFLHFIITMAIVEEDSTAGFCGFLRNVRFYKNVIKQTRLKNNSVLDRE